MSILIQDSLRILAIECVTQATEKSSEADKKPKTHRVASDEDKINGKAIWSVFEITFFSSSIIN